MSDQKRIERARVYREVMDLDWTDEMVAAFAEVECSAANERIKELEQQLKEQSK